MVLTSSHSLATWRSGVRGRSFHAVFALGIMLLLGAWLAASFSARQPQAVALDVGLSGIKIGLTLLSLMWVQELVSKEIDRRTVFFVLAYPAPRASYLLGRYMGVMALASAATILLGVTLALIVRFAGGDYQQVHSTLLGWPYVASLAMIMLDIALVTAFAFCLASFATSALLPLTLGFGFAIGSRALGPVMDFLARGADGDPEFAARYSPIINMVRWFLPDLDRLDLRTWPLYGVTPEWEAVALATLSALVYTVMLLSIAVAAFNRRIFA